MPDLTGYDLVNRDAGLNVGGAFLHAHAGEERAIGARVIAGAIRTSGGVPVVQSAENLDVLPDGFEWLKRLAQFKICSLGRWPPGTLNGAVGDVKERRSERRAGGCDAQLWRAGRRQRFEREQRFKRGQRNARTQPAQEISSAEAGGALGREDFIGNMFCFHGVGLASACCSTGFDVSAVCGAVEFLVF